MSNPVPRVHLPIQCSTLNVYVFVLRIEIDIAYRCRTIGDLVCNTGGLEEWRDDEIYVLARVGEETDVGEEGEGGH